MKTPFSLAFATIAAFFAASASAIELGWTAGPMASDGSTIRTDGTLLYAYSYHGGTVCGVLFTSVTDLANASMVSASPVIAGSVNSDFQTDGASGAFGHMMEGGWYWGGVAALRPANSRLRSHSRGLRPVTHTSSNLFHTDSPTARSSRRTVQRLCTFMDLTRQTTNTDVLLSAFSRLQVLPRML